MKPSKVFASRVKEVRTKKGLTQQQLADSLEGFNRPVVARIESGDREVKIDALIQICGVLGVSPIHMLVPTVGKEPVEIADVSLNPREAREWIRGQRPLHPEDFSTYFTEVSSEELRRMYDVSIVRLVNILDSVLDVIDESEGDLSAETIRTIEDRIELFDRELERQHKKGTRTR